MEQQLQLLAQLAAVDAELDEQLHDVRVHRVGRHAVNIMRHTAERGALACQSQGQRC